MAPLTRSVVARFNSAFKGNPHYAVKLSPTAFTSAAVNSYKFRCFDSLPLRDNSTQIQIVKAVDKIFGTRCVMAGGFPTFLLGKTTEYGDINFVLMCEAMPSAAAALARAQFFEDLVRHKFANELDVKKKWHFEAIGCGAIVVVVEDLPDHITMSFSEDNTASAAAAQLKMYENGVPVADFTLFERKVSFKNTDEPPILLEVGTRHLYELAEALRESYDTPLVMNIARIRPGGEMALECYDISGVLAEEKKLDGRHRPRFGHGSTTSTTNNRVMKYTKRLSKAYKTHCTEMRRLLLC